MHTFFFFFNVYFFKLKYSWFNYCVSFRCTAKWLGFKYIFIKYVYYMSVYTYITYLFFIAALFTIAKTWKQQKCLSTDEWIKKMWNIHTMENYSSIEEWNSAICSDMDGPRQCPTEGSKPKRERNTRWYCLYVGPKERYKWTFYKPERSYIVQTAFNCRFQ